MLADASSFSLSTPCHEPHVTCADLNASPYHILLGACASLHEANTRKMRLEWAYWLTLVMVA